MAAAEQHHLCREAKLNLPTGQPLNDKHIHLHIYYMRIQTTHANCGADLKQNALN